MNIQSNLLSINPMSRPGVKITKVKGVIIHYVGNPGSTAIANRNYFESLKNQKATYASSHYIIGLQGEIIQCIPENEVAYHANDANSYYIGIECCHSDASGKFNEKTYTSLVELTTDILKRYEVKEIKRHFDITGKICPKYYVENFEAWEQLEKDVLSNLQNKNVQTENEIKTIDEALKKLVDKNVINSPDYWRGAINYVNHLESLIINMSNKC